jgi:hypothetical protein
VWVKILASTGPDRVIGVRLSSESRQPRFANSQANQP